MSPLPRVDVFALGGTIASSGDDGHGALVRLSGDDLLGRLPEAAAVADLNVRSVRMVASGDLTLVDLLQVHELIETSVDSGVTGVVVTQGTDTLEEMAYGSELLSSSAVPIVFTGAMRPTSAPGSDGPANLLAAVRVAANEHARDLGTVVVFNDEIHASRHVRKGHTSSPATFRSPLTGPLGYVIEDRVRILLRPAGRLHVHVPAGAEAVRVAQLPVYFDGDTTLLRAVPGLGYGGLVVAAFGGGHVPSWLVPVLADVAERIPVVVASRTGCGEALQSTYAYPGSEVDLLRHGLISAVSLDAAHATVLLRLLLMAGVPRQDLGRCFEDASDPHGLVEVSVPQAAP